MPIYDPYSQPISLEYLGQFFKTLEPLTNDAISVIKKIQETDVDDFNETEVRAFIIDPIVRILGYDKGTDFSVDHGRKIEFLNKNKFPDYRFHLWQENFWIIEAKRPRVGIDVFEYDDLAQALEYAVHPKINAALVVLCDGLKIEVFDREASLTRPILHVDKANLFKDFDHLRRLLEPMQVWFFQKRRVVRLIDKVFDKEFNYQRIDEFKALIEARLAGKRSIVIENYRKNIPSDNEERRQLFEAAPLEDLVRVHLFFEHSIPETNAIFRNLVSRATHNPFHVLPNVFPYWPREINDTYIAQATIFLALLAKQRPHVDGLPPWLNQGKRHDAETAGATRLLLKQCLTYFGDDEAHRIILMAAAAIRRILRASALADEAQWRIGEVRHFMERYTGNELSFRQVVSSPAGHLLGLIDGAALNGIDRFVKDCLSEHREFKPEVAKIKLRELWNAEKAVLRGIPNFLKLYREREFSDMRTAGIISASYDVLGHLTLCLLHPLPEWKEYVLANHRGDIETIARLGSSEARRLLEIPEHVALDRPSDHVIAERFYLGDEATFVELRDKYDAEQA